MKVKTLRDGHDGRRAYAAGDVIPDSEHARALLASGLADPADDAAEKAAADPDFIKRHFRAAYAVQVTQQELTPARADRLKLVAAELAAAIKKEA